MVETIPLDLKCKDLLLLIARINDHPLANHICLSAPNPDKHTMFIQRLLLGCVLPKHRRSDREPESDERSER